MATDLKLAVKEGDQAPPFTANTSGGKKISLNDFKGRNVILYFYPRDDTPGCTKEACSFRDNFPRFNEKDAVVLGVSTDSVKAHDKFVNKFQLPFILIADEDKRIVQAWRAAGWPKGHYSIVTFDLKPTKTGTLLDFTHVGIPAHRLRSIDFGWKNYYWKPMKAAGEVGRISESPRFAGASVIRHHHPQGGGLRRRRLIRPTNSKM